MKDRVFRLGLRLTRLTEVVSAVLLVAVIVMNLAQVFFRYVLVDPLSWTEETMRYTTAWMVLLAGSAAVFRREHMAISLFAEARSAALRRAIHIAVLACIAGFCLLLMWEGFPAAIDNMRQVSPAVRIPMTIPYMAVPIGASLMFIKALCLILLPEDFDTADRSGESQP